MVSIALLLIGVSGTVSTMAHCAALDRQIQTKIATLNTQRRLCEELRASGDLKASLADLRAKTSDLTITALGASAKKESAEIEPDLSVSVTFPIELIADLAKTPSSQLPDDLTFRDRDGDGAVDSSHGSVALLPAKFILEWKGVEGTSTMEFVTLVATR